MKLTDKEVETSIIVRARELETQYGILEKDNQIKSLALANQASEKLRERQRTVTVLIGYSAAIPGLLLVGLWRRKQRKRNVKEQSLRQQLLRGQIASHFLFSSVNVLQDLIRKGNPSEATRFVQRLAQLFRLSLENARQPFVPLKNELDALNSYLTLQQSLFKNQFDYEIRVEGVFDQQVILIPPMLLQPVAENAVLHGFAGQNEKGHINISIQKDHKTLHCVIEDNGRGFQVVEDHRQKRPLSTVINQERLEILSRQTKTTAQIKITDKKATVGGGGVRVELIVPYQMG